MSDKNLARRLRERIPAMDKTMAAQMGGDYVEQIIGAAASPDARERCRAVELLGEGGDPRAVPALCHALADGDWMVRWRAIKALGGTGRPEAVPPLCRLLKEGEPLDRQAAAEALEQMAYRKPCPHLREALPLLLDLQGGFGGFVRAPGIQPFRRAHAAIDSATDIWKDLPLPAAGSAVDGEDLPRPAGAPETPAADLPVAAGPDAGREEVPAKSPGLWRRIAAAVRYHLSRG